MGISTSDIETQFEPATFLACTGLGRKIIHVKSKGTFFSQGGMADAVYYLQKGRAKLTVVSRVGKEATISLLSAGDFLGEEAIAGCTVPRLYSATGITPCTALKIERSEMVRVLHQEHEFSDFFLAFLLGRSMRTQADLVDQLFNSSEKRLARILLLLGEFEKQSEPELLLPKISQETLADMIGTTRSRVSFFMNRFRKLGYLQYDGRIRINRSLLNVVLHDQLLGENAAQPSLEGTSPDIRGRISTPRERRIRLHPASELRRHPRLPTHAGVKENVKAKMTQHR